MWLLVAPRAAKVLMVMRASGSSRFILASAPRNGAVRGPQPEATVRKSGCRLTRNLNCPPSPVGDHARLGPIAPTRTAQLNGPTLHDDPAALKSPFSSGTGCFLMRPDAGAVQKGHPELDPTRLGQEQQALPHAQVGPQVGPADEGLSRPPPRTKLSRDGAPPGPVLMAPEDGRERAPQILRRGLALGPAYLDQRLQPRPLCVAQHRPSSSKKGKTQEGQNARGAKRKRGKTQEGQNARGAKRP